LACRVEENTKTQFARLIINGVHRDVIRVERLLNFSDGEGRYVEVDLDVVEGIEHDEGFDFAGYEMSPKKAIEVLIWGKQCRA
jgi:hypothetical protein